MKAYLFPGQGSQRIGMGAPLFDSFPELTAAADAILGYSIKQLCLHDPDRRLNQTTYTQPALYVVNALSHRARSRAGAPAPDYVAGHSLGEYNALECAGVFSFEDGLRLVSKRGQLMAAAPAGAMAAVIGVAAGEVRRLLDEHGLDSVDIANYNSREQTVISGLASDIRSAQAVFAGGQGHFVQLNVSGAFHSRQMQAAAEQFGQVLGTVQFAAPAIPVIANLHAKPYRADDARRNLSDQLTHSVRWLDSMQTLLDRGVTDFEELGSGDVLGKLLRTIRSQYQLAAAPLIAIAAPSASTPQQRAETWNQAHAVGSAVRVAGYAEPLLTRSAAMVLFGHRAAIYLEGYQGYFALDEISPVTAP